MSRKSKYVVVGFGIAGSNVCWELFKRGVDFEIVDDGAHNASAVAAGMMNPIVFRRLTKSWMVDTVLPRAEEVYSKVGEVLGEEVLVRKNIRRVFASVEEENNWSTLEGDSRFEPYMDEGGPAPELVNAPYGTGIVKTIGHLKVKKFLQLSRGFFEKNGIQVHTERFDYSKIDTEKEYIFAEGYQVQSNPYFNYLRVKPAHGDVLIIQSEQLEIDEILNKKVWIQPLRNHCFKVGATFNWTMTTPDTTDSGREEMVETLDGVLKTDYKIIDQQAGFRATVPDRRPYLGTHPEKKNLHIFNGLGTKGVMLAPYFANHFLDYLLKGQELLAEVNIDRRLKWFEEYSQRK